MKSKRTEICIERENHSALLLRSFQQHLVICTGMGRLRPGDVVIVFTKSLHDGPGHMLVDENPHPDVGGDLTA